MKEGIIAYPIKQVVCFNLFTKIVVLCDQLDGIGSSANSKEFS